MITPLVPKLLLSCVPHKTKPTSALGSLSKFIHVPHCCLAVVSIWLLFFLKNKVCSCFVISVEFFFQVKYLKTPGSDPDPYQHTYFAQKQTNKQTNLPFFSILFFSLIISISAHIHAKFQQNTFFPLHPRPLFLLCIRIPFERVI